MEWLCGMLRARPATGVRAAAATRHSLTAVRPEGIVLPLINNTPYLFLYCYHVHSVHAVAIMLQRKRLQGTSGRHMNSCQRAGCHHCCKPTQSRSLLQSWLLKPDDLVNSLGHALTGQATQRGCFRC